MFFSRRQWDGLVKAWKIRIHEWDTAENGMSAEAEARVFGNKKRTHAQSEQSGSTPEGGSATTDAAAIIDNTPPGSWDEAASFPRIEAVSSALVPDSVIDTKRMKMSPKSEGAELYTDVDNSEWISGIKEEHINGLNDDSSA